MCQNAGLNCSNGCLDVGGTVKCFCPQGYKLATDNENCQGKGYDKYDIYVW